jgi:hypothetical protein
MVSLCVRSGKRGMGERESGGVGDGENGRIAASALPLPTLSVPPLFFSPPKYPT